MTIYESLADVLARSQSGNLFSELIQISDSYSVLELLTEIITTPSILQEVARRSYLHNNGFDKITLKVDSQDIFGPRIRLHIWWPRCRPPSDATIHNHAWNFASRLLCGQQESELFDRDDSGSEYHEYKCPTLANKDEFAEPVFQGISKLRSIQRWIHSATSIYAMDHMLIHRVTALGDAPTATLMLQGHHRCPCTSIFSSINHYEEDVFPKQHLRKDELRDKLSNLAGCMRTRSACT